MHIAYMTSEFMTEKLHGGLATYLDNIAGVMSGHGHRVTIITLSDMEGRIPYSANIEVVRVKGISRHNAEEEIGKGVDALINSWNMLRTLKKENRKNRIDIVQTANYRAIGFFRSHYIPTIIRASSDSAFLRNAELFEFDYDRTLKEKKLEDILELWCVKHADAAYAPSYFCASVIGKRSGRKLSVIESPYFYKECNVDVSIYREKLADKKYILFNSSLSRLKGTHVGIYAAEKLLKKFPDLYMVYAGYDCGLRQKDGNMQSVSDILSRQNKQYGGRVIYLGNLSHEQLFPVIQGAFACALPSRVDNLPNSCIETMALGGIVIGTYGASFEQLLTNKVNGLLFQRDSERAFIKSVEYLINMTENERIQMKRKAVDSIDRLEPDRIYNQLMLFYGNTIKNFPKKQKLGGWLGAKFDKCYHTCLQCKSIFGRLP